MAAHDLQSGQNHIIKNRSLGLSILEYFESLRSIVAAVSEIRLPFPLFSLQIR